MKKMLQICSVLLVMQGVPGGATAQVTDSSAQWTWISGSSALLQRGVLTTRGVENANYVPSARFDAAAWTDTAGNLWLFGGDYNNSNRLNDLWRYNIATGMWMWVTGSFSHTGSGGFNQLGVYGTQGTTASANTPGGRRGMNCWTDASGRFWLFGGYGRAASGGTGYLNDMWMFDPATTMWTWVSGANTLNNVGDYGTMGVASPTNQPRSRGGTYASGASAMWVDDAGNFWMFGGFGRGTGSTENPLNDLWKYDPVTKNWTWMGGSNTFNQPGVYGTKGVAASTNYPGARYAPSYWKDSDGKFWMFGGHGVGSSGITQGRLNDLWKYDPVTNEWTWVHGTDVVEQAAVYGNRGAFAAANTPGGRVAMGIGDSWVDINGKFWFYAGYGISNATAGYLEELWCYDPATNMWAWMNGSPAMKTPGVYGTQGVTDPANYPGARAMFVQWMDKDQNFWIHGGMAFSTSSQNSKSDLWRLAPLLPPAQPGRFTSAKTSVCRGEANVTYTVPAVSAATSYDWEYSGSNVTLTANTTTPTNTVNFAANATSGNLRVRAVNSNGAGDWRDTSITVNVLPTVTSTNTGNQTICAGESLTLTASGTNGVTYQWKRGTTNVGTGTSYQAQTAGSYTVTGTVTATGCSATATPPTTLTVTPLPNVSITPATMTICAGESATLTASGATTYSWSSGGSTAAITVSPATTTTYTVTGTTSGCATSVSRQVTVSPLPTVTSTNTGNRAICDGDSLMLTASGTSGVSYQWKEGSTNVGTGNTFYARTTGTYTVTATNASTNCSATSTPATVLTVNPRPVATVTAGGSTEVCVGTSVTLTASTVAGANYQWMQDGANVGTNINTHAAHTTGAYQVIVTNPQTGCFDSSTAVDVFVYDRPVVALTPGDTVFCDGGHVTLEVASQDTGLTYLWKNGSATVQQATAYFLEITETGIYKVIVGRDGIPGCEDSTNETTVTVHPLPVVDIVWDGETFHATPGYVSYQWQTSGQGIPGADDSTYTPEAHGGYSVTVTDGNNCTTTSPVYNVKVGIEDMAKLGDQIRIYPNPAGEQLYIAAPMPVSVSLSSIDGKMLLQQHNARQINLSQLADGVYMLRITNENGLLIRYEKIVKRN